MAAFIFSKDEAGEFTLRKAIFRMILSRATERLTDPADLEMLEVAEAMEGLVFIRLEENQRARISKAVLEGAKRLRQQITAREPVEEPVLLGIEDKLDELISFMSDHTPQTK